MFDDIRGDTRIKPVISFILASCMVIITVLCILIPQLKSLYGVSDGPAINYMIRLTVPFQHGFDDLSAGIHLGINLVFMWIFGTFLEKVIGSFRYLVITLIAYLLYIIFHRVLLLLGNGFTPIILAYSGVILVVLSEGKYVKTRSVFEDYYKTLRGVLMAVWIILPFVMAFVPMYFDSGDNLLMQAFYGNIVHVVAGISGVVMGFIYRGHIRSKLIQHTRKRYIKHDRIDQLAVYAALGFPLYLILIFFIHPS